MADFVGAVDQGTTSTRFMVFDHDGNEVGRHQLEHEQILPRAGWVEHDPLEIWERTKTVVGSCLTSLHLTAADIDSIGITNQRETTVVWDKNTGRPYTNAIVWQDTRTDSIVKALDADGRGDTIRQRAGLVPAPYFSGGKLQWMLENVDGLEEAAAGGDALFGTVDSWVVWNLTGGPNGGQHVTDVTNASRTMLMDLETLQWDDELLGLLRHPSLDAPRDPAVERPAALRAYRAAAVRGTVRSRSAGRSATSTRPPWVRSASRPATRRTPTAPATSCCSTPARRSSVRTHGLLTTVAYQLGDAKPVYALEGSIAVTGSAVQWLRDQLGLIRSSEDVETFARQVEDNGGVYFVPAFSGLFAPYWRSDARGAVVGLSRFNTAAHLARATLEAICYQTRDVADAMVRGQRRGRPPAWTCASSRSTAVSPRTTSACRSRPTCSGSR